MTEKLRQSLSAVIDDEADAFELRRVLDELGRDDDLRALWDRYHFIGNALRGEPANLSSSVRDRVWQALAMAPEPGAGVGVGNQPDLEVVDAAETQESGSRLQSRSRLGRYTGLAVAATVAFAVVLGFNDLGSKDGDVDGTPAVVASGVEPAPAVRPGIDEAVRGAVAGPAEVSPVDVQRAQAYILHHTQQQALNQAGVMSFVKLATYEAP